MSAQDRDRDRAAKFLEGRRDRDAILLRSAEAYLARVPGLQLKAPPNGSGPRLSEFLRRAHA